MAGYHQTQQSPRRGTYFFLAGMAQRRGLDKDARRWCTEQFGPPMDDALTEAGDGWTMNQMGDVWIKDMDRAFAFKMRWC